MIGEKRPSNILKNLLIILTTFLLSLIIIIGGLALYIYVKNPFNIQACLISSFLTGDVDNQTGFKTGAKTGASTQFDHPLLSDKQEAMLENAGINVSTLPTTISPEMKDCVIKAIGEDRVNEIISGSAPGLMDILRAKSCL